MSKKLKKSMVKEVRERENMCLSMFSSTRIDPLCIINAKKKRKGKKEGVKEGYWS